MSPSRRHGGAAHRHRETGAIASHLRPEQELLLRCARTRLDSSTRDGIRALAEGGIDWERLRRLAAAHRLVPLLLTSLEAACADLVPDALLGALRAERTAGAATSLSLAGELVGVLRALDDEGVPALPIKGPVLALYVYGNLGSRTYLDLDLIVSPREVPAALRVLTGLGYRSAYGMRPHQNVALSRCFGHYVLEREGCAGPIELHPRFTPERFSFCFDPADALRRAERITLAGRSIPTLAREDLLLFLCVHGAKHLWRELEWVCGVAELLRSVPMDFDVIFRLAERTGATRRLLLGLRVACELLDVLLPPEVHRLAAADQRVGALATHVYERLFPASGAEPTAEETLRDHLGFHMRSMERARDRLRYVYRDVTLPSPAEWALLGLPDWLAPAYRVIRPVRLAGKYGARAIRRLG